MIELIRRLAREVLSSLTPVISEREELTPRELKDLEKIFQKKMKLEYNDELRQLVARLYGSDVQIEYRGVVTFDLVADIYHNYSGNLQRRELSPIEEHLAVATLNELSNASVSRRVVPLGALDPSSLPGMVELDEYVNRISFDYPYSDSIRGRLVTFAFEYSEKDDDLAGYKSLPDKERDKYVMSLLNGLSNDFRRLQEPIGLQRVELFLPYLHFLGKVIPIGSRKQVIYDIIHRQGQFTVESRGDLAGDDGWLQSIQSSYE